MILEDPVLLNNFNELNSRVKLGPMAFTTGESSQVVIELGEHKIVSLDDTSHFDLPAHEVESIDHFAYLANGNWQDPQTELDQRSAVRRLADELHPADLERHEIDDWMARAERGMDEFSPQEQFKLYEALSAYVIGRGELIPNLAVIANRLLFPMSMGLFTARHLILKDHAQLTFSGSSPIFMNVGKLELHGVSCINVHAPLIGFAQVTDATKRDARTTMLSTTKHGLYSNPSLNLVPPQAPPADDGHEGDHGSQPPKATPNGSSYKTTTGNCPYQCSTQPAAGEPGGKGEDGGKGNDGDPGTNVTNTNAIDLGTISGQFTLNYGGGTGQKGGKGGNGGDGGPGGLPGDSATGCDIKTSGPAGPGGKGGRGGNGGAGGSSVSNKVVWKGTADVLVGYNLENGGKGGAQGTGGGGNPAGGTDGPGTDGTATAPGTLLLQS